ncbi:MAG: CbbQ/NirQ/NorQ C-terminal domain-containing protein, partial [Spirochaetales bacterium]|nr:CbbQ/NirQ/NorQ C-terminal domain-containing protein [Spirochaetales bacterium]
LNSVLDGSPLCIAENGGELITPHPMFRFVATANTNGGGDETGLYQGTQRQNLAFADRFILCEIGYPSPEIERRLVRQRFPSLPRKLCRTMVEYANEIRKLFMGEGPSDNPSNTIEVTLSTRSLLRWADLTVRFQPLAHQGIQPVTYALDRALAFRASRETRAMLHELAQRHFPHQPVPGENATANYNGLVNGEDAVNLLRQKLEQDISKPQRISLSKTYTTPEGEERTKLWTAESNKSGLIVSWGREGCQQQQKYFPIAECQRLNPVTDMMTRAERKIREGYSLITNKSFM